MSFSSRQFLLKQHNALQQERSTWLPHWRDLADYNAPRRYRYLLDDTNKGSKRSEKIINNTPVKARNILASGMVAGITSPARPWFRLTLQDTKLANHGAVREWLHQVEEILRGIFAKSNFYNAMPLLYSDLALFGTSPMIMDEDDEDVIRCYIIPVGSYCLANSGRMRVDTLFRELRLTVAQCVEMFSFDKCSPDIQLKFKQNELQKSVDVIHAIMPRKEREYGMVDGLNKPWKSCWFEKNGGESYDGFLREWGYDDFPVMAPRWLVTGEDVYGESPGMVTLGDNKALQLYEKRSAQGVDKIVNPPMVGPTSLRTQRASLLSGDITYSDTSSGGEKFRPAVEINANAISVADAKIERLEGRINSGFYADLWLAVTNSRGDMTATEVAQRHEEQLLMLGPVLERLHDELLDPALDRSFYIANKRGLLPAPPPALEGQDLKIEYLSLMAQAQKLVSTSSVERFASFAGNIAAVKPEILDKINGDKLIEEYAMMTGINPAIVVSDEAVAAKRQQRLEQQQAEAQGQAMERAATGAKTLSETDMQGDTALNRLLGGLGQPPISGTA